MTKKVKEVFLTEEEKLAVDELVQKIESNNDYLKNLDLGRGLAGESEGLELEELIEDNESMEPLKNTDELHKIKPGAANHHIEIEIHTHPAYGLILGRKFENNDDQNNSGTEVERKKLTYPIVGLFGFATSTRNLIIASAYDDPFADKLLLKIESLMDELEQSIDSAMTTVEEMINNLKKNGINPKRMSSKNPIKIPLIYNSPYAMRLAYLIVKFDQLVRHYLPLRQMQIINYDQWGLAFIEPREIFRRTTSCSWQFTNKQQITREMVEDHEDTPNPIIANALKRYGALSSEILDKTLRPFTIYPTLQQGSK